MFHVHKCLSKKCPYYLSTEEKYKYKLHYIYREFTLDFFAMDPYSLPGNATTFQFKKFNPHVLGLVLTYHVNLQLSTRKTAHALEEIHGIKLSHTTVANYAMTAAVIIKPFVDSYDYKPSNILSADETYIKKLGTNLSNATRIYRITPFLFQDYGARGITSEHLFACTQGWRTPLLRIIIRDIFTSQGSNKPILSAPKFSYITLHYLINTTLFMI